MPSTPLQPQPSSLLKQGSITSWLAARAAPARTSSAVPQPEAASKPGKQESGNLQLALHSAQAPGPLASAGSLQADASPQVAQLEATLARVTAQANSWRSRGMQAEADSTALRSKLRGLQQEVASLQEQSTKRQRMAEDYQEENKVLQNQVEALQQGTSKARLWYCWKLD